MGQAKRFRDKYSKKIDRFYYLLRFISKQYTNDQVYEFTIKTVSGKRKKITLDKQTKI